MAQIQEQLVVIRLSKLAKKGESTVKVEINEDFIATVEAVVTELINDESVIVEVGDLDE